MVWNKKIFTKEQTEEIIKMYDVDLINCDIIGNKFNCEAGVIRRILKENNINMTISYRLKKLYENEKIITHNKGKPFLVGEKNPMYGKIHPNKGKKGEWHWNEESKLKQKKPKSEKLKKKWSETRKKLIAENSDKIKIFGRDTILDTKGEKNPRYKYNKSESNAPLCKCGCGEKTNFNYALKRFCEYLPFHHIQEGENNPNYKKIDEKEMIRFYKNGHSSFYIAEILGVSNSTILSKLRNNGIKIRESRFRNKILKTIDGHLVKSSPELEIDNFLFENKIIHSYNGFIADTRYRYDFYLPEFNLYIEFWGLMDKENYKEKTKIKIELYQKLGLNLLSIFPKDNLKEKLNIILDAKNSGIKEIKII